MTDQAQPIAPQLRGRRCAECGSDRLTAPQPGVDPRFVTAACYGCAPTIADVITPKRVATYVACPEAAGWDQGVGERVKIPCLLPIDPRHVGGHSKSFVRLAPKTRGAIRGVRPGKDRGQIAELDDVGSFTSLAPGWEPKP